MDGHSSSCACWSCIYCHGSAVDGGLFASRITWFLLFLFFCVSFFFKDFALEYFYDYESNHMYMCVLFLSTSSTPYIFINKPHIVDPLLRCYHRK